MKQLKKIYAIVFAASVVFLTSCSNDDEAKIDRTEVLTSKTWVMTKMEMTYKGTTVDASDAFVSDCQKDNSIKFAKDGKYEELEGANECDFDTESQKGTWAWNNDQTVIIVTFEWGTQEMKVLKMTKNSMTVDLGMAGFDFDQDNVEDDVKMTATLTAK